MLAILSRSLPLSSNFTLEEEVAEASEKQGIVSILGSHFEKADASPSLHRTLSADTSSRKWLAQNGLPSENMISPSQDLLASIDGSSSTSSDREENYEEERLEIWNSIQKAKLKKDQEVKEELTSWASILSQKGEDSKSLPPYVHPLVKRTSSTLSKKSLEICTESLGSETGTDGFSSYPPSEMEDAEDDKAEENLLERAKSTIPIEEHGLPPIDYNNYMSPMKAAESRTFPPPLPSLSRENRSSLSMRSSRNNGRLVLKAVSVSPDNNFQAQRHEGRLILNFVNSNCTIHQEVENAEAV